jgi:hypothetical protein
MNSEGDLMIQAMMEDKVNTAANNGVPSWGAMANPSENVKIVLPTSIWTISY